MKTLGEVCKTTYNSARKMGSLLAESASSSTRNGGLMIMTPAALAAKDPRENDKSLLHCLNHMLKLSLSIETRSRFGEYGWEPDYRVVIRDMDDEKKAQALAVVEQYSVPLPASKIAELIARLQIIAPEREKSAVDIKARTAIWIEELSSFPADVVTKALKGRYRWFPSLAEVLESCENEMAYRNLIKRGIRCFYDEIKERK